MRQLSLQLDDAPILPRIHARLLPLHGPQRDELRCGPTALFFKASISANTYDEISDAAFERLCIFLRSWDTLPDADPEAIAGIIHDVTYARDKAFRLVAAARIIQVQRGRIDLAFLADWPVPDALHWLDRLPGAGSKVAAVTLNFSTLRKAVLVVDRHLLRSFKRIGLLPPKADFARGHRILQRFVPNHWDGDDCYEFHWLMKLHGQKTCRAPWPTCGECPLTQLCANSAA